MISRMGWQFIVVIFMVVVLEVVRLRVVLVWGSPAVGVVCVGGGIRSWGL